MTDTEKKDLDLLLGEVRLAAARFGAQTIRRMILAYADHAGVETASITTPASGGAVTLTADELSYAKKRGLDPVQMAAVKAKAIADGTYPGLAG